MLEDIFKVGSDERVKKDVQYYFGQKKVHPDFIKKVLNDSNWYKQSNSEIQEKLNNLYKEKQLDVSKQFPEDKQKEYRDKLNGDSKFQEADALFNYKFSVDGYKIGMNEILKTLNMGLDSLLGYLDIFKRNYQTFNLQKKDKADMLELFLKAMLNSRKNLVTSKYNVKIGDYYPQNIYDMLIIFNHDKLESNIENHINMCKLLKLNIIGMDSLLALYSMTKKSTDKINILDNKFDNVFKAYEYYVAQEEIVGKVENMLNHFTKYHKPQQLNSIASVNFLFNYYLAREVYITNNYMLKNTKQLKTSKLNVYISPLITSQAQEYFKLNQMQVNITDVQKRLYLFLCKIEGRFTYVKGVLTMYDKNNVVIPKDKLTKIKLNSYTILSVKQLIQEGLLYSETDKNNVINFLPNKKYKNHL